MNKRIIDYLDKIAESGSIPHAILLAGPLGSPKGEVALNFGRKLVKSSHDLYTYHPEGGLGLHSIESLRSFIQDVNLPPFEGTRKVFVIHDVERMLPTGANALLKTLEEPLATSLLLLTATFPDKLLPTIRSRCQILYFSKESFHLEEEHPVVSILASLPNYSAVQLLNEVGHLAEKLEYLTKQPEMTIEIELTPWQKQTLEKEIEGKEALALSFKTDKMWEAILGWFRDLHVLHLAAPKKCLMHPYYQSQMQQWIEQGILPPIELIEKTVFQAKKSLERSGSLKNILESLFLRLHKWVKEKG